MAAGGRDGGQRPPLIGRFRQGGWGRCSRKRRAPGCGLGGAAVRLWLPGPATGVRCSGGSRGGCAPRCGAALPRPATLLPAVQSENVPPSLPGTPGACGWLKASVATAGQHRCRRSRAEPSLCAVRIAGHRC